MQNSGQVLCKDKKPLRLERLFGFSLQGGASEYTTKGTHLTGQNEPQKALADLTNKTTLSILPTLYEATSGRSADRERT